MQCDMRHLTHLAGRRRRAVSEPVTQPKSRPAMTSPQYSAQPYVAPAWHFSAVASAQGSKHERKKNATGTAPRPPHPTPPHTHHAWSCTSTEKGKCCQPAHTQPVLPWPAASCQPGPEPTCRQGYHPIAEPRWVVVACAATTTTTDTLLKAGWLVAARQAAPCRAVPHLPSQIRATPPAHRCYLCGRR